ncbi:MAG: S4 domain-containing protein [bacterium]
MRLDLFLTLSRLVKRRSAAKALADSGAVEIGGAPAKAGRILRVGDELEVRLGRREIRLRVAALPQRRPTRAQAPSLYEVLSEREAAEPFEALDSGEAIDFLTRR